MNPTYSTRYTLLERAKNQSDAQAWEELIGIYRKYIYVIIRSMNVNTTDTEDVLQLVVMELWKYLPKYEYNKEGAKFRYWVAKVTRNQVISFIRRQQAHLKKMDHVQAESLISYLETITQPEVEELATREWQLFISNAAMQNIQSNFSSQAIQAFKLFSEGLKPDEIAQRIDVKTDSVYKYISRIKLRLIEEIQLLQKELLLRSQQYSGH